jgi:hypothetical protein
VSAANCLPLWVAPFLSVGCWGAIVRTTSPLSEFDNDPSGDEHVTRYLLLI